MNSSAGQKYEEKRLQLSIINNIIAEYKISSNNDLFSDSSTSFLLSEWIEFFLNANYLMCLIILLLLVAFLFIVILLWFRIKKIIQQILDSLFRLLKTRLQVKKKMTARVIASWKLFTLRYNLVQFEAPKRDNHNLD